MRAVKFHIICFIFNIKPVLIREMGINQTKKIIFRMKRHFSKLDKTKPPMKGIMGFHRMFLILGLSLYRAMEEELRKTDDLVEKIHKIIWEGRTY